AAQGRTGQSGSGDAGRRGRPSQRLLRSFSLRAIFVEPGTNYGGHRPNALDRTGKTDPTFGSIRAPKRPGRGRNAMAVPYDPKRDDRSGLRSVGAQEVSAICWRYGEP